MARPWANLGHTSAVFSSRCRGGCCNVVGPPQRPPLDVKWHHLNLGHMYLPVLAVPPELSPTRTGPLTTATYGVLQLSLTATAGVMEYGRDDWLSTQPRTQPCFLAGQPVRDSGRPAMLGRSSPGSRDQSRPNSPGRGPGGQAWGKG